MKHLKIVKSLFILFALLACFSSCFKDPPSEPVDRLVKYEITGNYTGKLTIVYNDNVNGNTVSNNDSIPWRKEFRLPLTVTAIGIGAQSSVAGLPGQTVTIKIYSSYNVVKTSTATAGSLGEIVVPAITYNF